MKLIREIKINKHTGYIELNDVTGAERQICCSFSLSNLNGKNVVVFQDSKGKLLKDFNDFINRPSILGLDEQYIYKMCYHLRTFYNFLELYNLNFSDMVEEEKCTIFVAFLTGTLGIEACTKRNNAYVNRILITVRAFLIWKKIDTPLSRIKEKDQFMYSLTEKSIKENPVMYIDRKGLVMLSEVILNSPALYSTAFKKKKQEMDQKYNKKKAKIEKKGCNFALPAPEPLPEYDEQGYLIFRLGVNRGMRLGEILGLTCEDVVLKKDSNGKMKKGIYLRNRISDYDYQSAKELLHPKSFADYSTNKYNKNNIGTTYIPLDDKTWDMLQRIITRDLPVYALAYPENAESAKADSVTGQGINSYIFRNRYGSRLSDQAWNKRVKDYFCRAGLNVDKGHKEANLTHRFRHSYAMLFAKNGNVSDVWLASLLRHKNVSTVKKYFTPTEDDIRDIYEAYEGDIVDQFLEEYKNSSNTGETDDLQ